MAPPRPPPLRDVLFQDAVSTGGGSSYRGERPALIGPPTPRPEFQRKCGPQARTKGRDLEKPRVVGRGEIPHKTLKSVFNGGGSSETEPGGCGWSPQLV